MMRSTKTISGTFRAAALASVAALWLAGAAQASIVVTPASNGTSDTAFNSNISSTDLINLGQLSYASGTITGDGPDGGSSLNGARDGLFGSSGNLGNKLWVGQTANSATITFSLNTNSLTGGSATGYDITGVNVFQGWNSWQGFANQQWTLRVATVADPTVFNDIQTVNYTPFGGAGSPASSEVSLTDTTGVIAKGVAAVRFYFPGRSNGSLINEIDILGAASIPEPGSLTLLSLLGGALLLRRKLRQA